MKRSVEYLRISVTDRCNLRCRYCMPEKLPFVPHESILRYEEMIQIARAGAAEGIRHIRVTGGEPLVRKDLPVLIRGLKGIPGVETVSMTTNGMLLSENLPALKEAGIDGINISLDTTDPVHYQSITGTDGAATVLKAIEDAFDAGIRTKINAAVMEETRPEEIFALVKLAENRSVYVRFIEMMPIGYGAGFKTVDNGKVRDVISGVYPALSREEDGDYEKRRRCGYGPAVYYRIPGFAGQIGFISAIHGKFCDTCNRLRLTAAGFLKYCLCFEDGEDLSGIVRGPQGDAEKEALLREAFRRAGKRKPAGHRFSEKGGVTEKKPMSGIGG